MAYFFFWVYYYLVLNPVHPGLDLDPNLLDLKLQVQVQVWHEGGLNLKVQFGVQEK